MFGKPKDNNSKAGWMTLAEIAVAFNVTAQAFAKTYRPLIDPAHVRTTGGSVRILCRGAIDALVAHRVAEAVADARKNSDPMLAGGN
jgi:hypothetical protein